MGRVSRCCSRFQVAFLKRPKRYFACITLCAAIAVVFGWRESLFRSAGQFLNVGRPLAEPVDSVLILGGDLQTRPFVAAEIFRAQFTCKILVVKVAESNVIEKSPTASNTEITLAALKYRGVPAEAVQVLDSQTVDSTRDEASVLHDYLKSHPNVTVAIVTNDYHTRRTRMTFRRMIGAPSDRLRFVSAPTDGFSPEDWFYFRQGWSTYMLEYFKLVYHFLTLSGNE